MSVLLRADHLAALPADERAAVLAALTDAEVLALAHDWRFWARPDQVAPALPWDAWIIMAGRGFGKTRAGSEWVREQVDEAERFILVAPTAADVRDTMIEGESGLLAVFPPDQRPVYEPSKRRIEFHNGAFGLLFSGDEPDRLRGPQGERAWVDEMAAMRYGPDVWSNLLFGLRLGRNPRALVTTTPKPLQWLRKEVIGQPGTVVTRGRTLDNAANLAPNFLRSVVNRYAGTRLGRQELDGVLLDEVEGALWTPSLVEAQRAPRLPLSGMAKPQMAVDPPGETAEAGIVVAVATEGRRGDTDRQVYVVEDASTPGAPEHWARVAIDTMRRWGCPCIWVESNQGGDMVRAVIHAADPTVRVVKVRADKSKQARAEPVSVLWVRKRAWLVGLWPMLEEQMTTWTPGEKSPDRLDAMVYAVLAALDELGRAMGTTLRS